MAETRTARFGFPKYSLDADPFGRLDWNELVDDLEALAAQYAEGTRAARPAAGTAGRLYTVEGDATAAFNGGMFYDNGAGWISVGANVEDALARSSAAGTVPQTVRGAASQTADLQKWQNSAGTDLLRVTPTGGIVQQAGVANGFGGATVTGVRSAFHTGAAAEVGVAVRGVANQTGDLQQWRSSGDAVLARVTAGGALNVDAAPGVDGSAFGGASASGVRLAISTGQPGTIGMRIRGVANQTADYLSLEASTGAVRARVDHLGNATFTSVTSQNLATRDGAETLTNKTFPLAAGRVVVETDAAGALTPTSSSRTSPTGAFVGTTDVQTLSSKDISDASNTHPAKVDWARCYAHSSPQLLAANGAVVQTYTSVSIGNGAFTHANGVLTCVRAGVYTIDAGTALELPTGTIIGLALLIDGQAVSGNTYTVDAGHDLYNNVSCSQTRPLTVGQTVSVAVRANAAGSFANVDGNYEIAPHLYVHRVA